MLLTYYAWIKSVKTGSILWSAFTALAYFYMVRQISVSNLIVNINLITYYIPTNNIYFMYIILILFIKNNILCLNNILFLGIILGWLCVFNQFNTNACICFDGYWTFFT